MENLQVKTAPGTERLEVLTGAAQVIRDPKILNISGTIESPFAWLEKRIETIEQLKAHVIVNREKLSISLKIEDKNHFSDTITGKAELHPAFVKFSINTNTYRTPKELAQLFKMNRSFFENKSEAMMLVSELQNFKAKIDGEVEKADDNRGNRKLLVQQAVNSNVPDNFKVNVPIFKGGKPETIEVEIYIEADDLTCCLISPQANERVEELRDSMIDAELSKIEKIAPHIVIIEE